MKMSVNRVLLFASVVLAAGLGLRAYWSSFSPAEKWLYVYEQPAREYAVSAMGKPTQPGLPEALAETEVTVHDDHVRFSPRRDPTLVLAFSVGTPPDDPGDGRAWRHVEGSWYVLSAE